MFCITILKQKIHFNRLCYINYFLCIKVAIVGICEGWQTLLLREATVPSSMETEMWMVWQKMGHRTSAQNPFLT